MIDIHAWINKFLGALTEKFGDRIGFGSSVFKVATGAVRRPKRATSTSL